MPRTPRNPGSGKPPHNGPARGAGWGGAARPGVVRETIQTNPQFSATHQPAPGPTPWRERKNELSEKAMGVWEGVIDDPRELAQNRIVAAEKIMNRVEGMPKQVQEHTGDMAFTIVTGVPRADD